MKRTFSLSVVVTAVLFSLIACGGKETKEANTEEETVTEETVTEPETAAPAAGNTLNIESTDQMQYTTNELKATAGTITLTLKHNGKMEKSVMGHNLVILKPGTDIAAFAQKAAEAKATDYIPESGKGSIIAHTKVIGGGESDTIEFTIAEKGTYDFICSFPGHYAVMKGKLIVE
ncbi:azurin [Flavobacterium sp. UBA4197]|uniref:azurin n=1 Tax=Flavobacterium sp. UBA4197 TaxID=1946546 RepID=UPI00258110B5|nr:azurin [Flavobacterium sp. UBA4197]